MVQPRTLHGITKFQSCKKNHNIPFGPTSNRMLKSFSLNLTPGQCLTREVVGKKAKQTSFLVISLGSNQHKNS